MKSEFWDVPQGKIAAVVTHLQMFERPAERPAHFDAGTLIAHVTPDLEWYRDLFTRVGGQDWLWFSRLGMSDDELAAILNDPANQIYSVTVDGRDVGMLELDFRIAGECEIGYFGLIADMVGTGAGRWLMEQALSKAWAEPITRLHVHTCTLDSPQALPFYVRSGFTAFKREIEIADDPRLVGALPKDSTPQLPIIPE
ncbi:GNAT family N-acetyltransferase [Octadecabacter sp. 1_MG-2023]|uniref:GNAT family N-acetyltransferase n=1 Tax=unclassified Octadecabacter TaxID=196158 RepID=UPI001C09009C|nr:MULTISPECIES: GNAT family N-acetyltransferase [unclassified Octadecabacter]MBU2992905.1 GNAT family N-acetyltransferase [Octadecabacter sp. B2R22]MDO6733644.1 GNAT family N-acetyltransferase [Octadecabacter sp. 1_MG-2023]